MKTKIMLLLALAYPLASGCGSDAKLVAREPTEEEGEIEPGDDDGPVAEKISYSQMQGYLNIYCQKCHTGDKFMQSESLLRSSQVKTRIANGSMPLPNAKQLPSNIKSDMLNFF